MAHLLPKLQWQFVEFLQSTSFAIFAFSARSRVADLVRLSWSPMSRSYNDTSPGSFDHGCSFHKISFSTPIGVSSRLPLMDRIIQRSQTDRWRPRASDVSDSHVDSRYSCKHILRGGSNVSFRIISLQPQALLPNDSLKSILRIRCTFSFIYSLTKVTAEICTPCSITNSLQEGCF